MCCTLSFFTIKKTMKEINIVQEIFDRLDRIERYIAESIEKQEYDNYDDYVDSNEVMRYLNISNRTLQRLRTERLINYTILRGGKRGRAYYLISDIRDLMHRRIIKSTKEQLNDLIFHHRKRNGH